MGRFGQRSPPIFNSEFGLDRVKALAPQHPEWKKQKPFTYILAGDMKRFSPRWENSMMT